MKIDVVTGFIVSPEMAERNHLAFAARRNARRRSYGAGWYAKEGCKYNIFAPIVLVSGVPYRAIIAQASEQAPKVFGSEYGFISALPCPGHNGVHERIVVITLHYIGFDVLGDQAATEIQCTVMTAQQQNALALGQRVIKVLLAVNFRYASELCRVSEPCNTQFNQADSVGDKGISNQRSLLRLIELREAQPDIHLGYVATSACKTPGQKASAFAEPPLKTDGKLGHTPHKGNPCPGRPPARVEVG